MTDAFAAAQARAKRESASEEDLRRLANDVASSLALGSQISDGVLFDLIRDIAALRDGLTPPPRHLDRPMVRPGSPPLTREQLKINPAKVPFGILYPEPDPYLREGLTPPVESGPTFKVGDRVRRKRDGKLGAVYSFLFAAEHCKVQWDGDDSGKPKVVLFSDIEPAPAVDIGIPISEQDQGLAVDPDVVEAREIARHLFPAGADQIAKGLMDDSSFVAEPLRLIRERNAARAAGHNEAVEKAKARFHAYPQRILHVHDIVYLLDALKIEVRP